MSYQIKKRTWSIGRHSSTADFSSTPGTFRQLAPEVAPVPLAPRRQQYMRNPVRLDAKHPVPIETVKDVSGSLALELLLCGPAANTGAAITSATATEVGDLLDTCLGAATDPAGAATTVTGGDGATPDLDVTSAAGLSVGMTIGFTVDSGTLVVRQITEINTNQLVLDRTFTGTVDTGGGTTVYRSPRWVVNPAVHELVHSFFRCEDDEELVVYKGCMGTARIDLAVGAPARAIFDFGYTDVDSIAKLSPSYTGPSRGNVVVTSGNRLWIGNASFMASSIGIDFGGARKARAANSGPQGMQGFTLERGGDNAPLPTIACDLYAGSSTTLGEVQAAAEAFRANYARGYDRTAGQDARSFDVALQAGAAVTGIAYSRAPLAVPTGFEMIDLDGKKGYRCTFTCFDPTSGYPLDLSLL